VSSVTVATTAKALGDPELLHTLEIFEVAPRVAAQGIVVHPEAFVTGVADGTVTVLGRDEPLGPFDAIVLSTGAVGRELPEDALAAGDCVAPRGIWSATTDAGRIARTI
jgi:hypothetical protein